MARFDRLRSKEDTLEALGAPMRGGAKILDLGCGAGGLVADMLERGYDAYGTDLTFKSGPHVEKLIAEGRLKKINPSDFLLPFPDDYFDFVNTDQVVEHVQNHGAFLKELHRVLKPGAISLHIFPPKFIPIEPHVYVPFAGLIRNCWWLWLWAALGVRKQDQQNMPLKQVVQDNRDYLLKKTNYLTVRQLKRLSASAGLEASFCEGVFLNHYSPLSKRLVRLFPGNSLISWLCRHFVSVVMLLRKAE